MNTLSAFVIVIILAIPECMGVSFVKKTGDLDTDTFFSIVNKSSKTISIFERMDNTKNETRTILPDKAHRTIIDMNNINWDVSDCRTLKIDDTIMQVDRSIYDSGWDKNFRLNIVKTDGVVITDDTRELNAANVGSLWVKIDSAGFERALDEMYIRIYDSRDVGMHD
jgi:hypothetical protein